MPARLTTGLLLVAVTAIWGYTFVVVKEATNAYSVPGFLGWRFLLATAVLAPWGLSQAGRAAWKPGVVCGLLLAGAYFCQTYGLRLENSSAAGLITGLFVVIAPIADWLMFGSRPGFRQWSGVGLSLGGLMLLTGQSPHSMQWGAWLLLGGACFLGGHIAVLTHWSPGRSAMALTFWQMLTVSLFGWLAWPLEPGDHFWPTSDVWIAIALCGVLASAVGFWAQTWAQQRLSTIQTAVILSLEPVFAVVFGVWLMNDSFTPWMWTGAGLMLLAALVVEIQPRADGLPDPDAIVSSGRADPSKN